MNCRNSRNMGWCDGKHILSLLVITRFKEYKHSMTTNIFSSPHGSDVLCITSQISLVPGQLFRRSIRSASERWDAGASEDNWWTSLQFVEQGPDKAEKTWGKRGCCKNGGFNTSQTILVSKLSLHYSSMIYTLLPVYTDHTELSQNMGVSENSVALNPLVNDHFQTNPYGYP